MERKMDEQEEKDKLEERFWSKVDKDGPTMSHMDTPCWIWTAYCNEKGYGIIGKVGPEKKNKKAHRIAYTIVTGQEIEDGKPLLHACDNGLGGCVNPHHLSPGTIEENNRQMLERNRYVKGNDVITSIINEEIVLDIRVSFDNGMSRKQISEKHNISKDLVNQVISGESWKHVGGPIVKRKPRSKITEEVAKDILMRDAMGEMQKDIAAHYEVDRSHVSKIVSGKKYKSLDPEYREKCKKIKQERLSRVTR
jgi:hypothetical protein